MSWLSSTETSLSPKKKKTDKRGVCPGFPSTWPARWNYAPATQTHQLANQDRFPSKRHTSKTLWHLLCDFMKENHIKSSVWRGSVGRATLSGESGCRHLGVALPGTYTSQTFPSEHSPTNNRIDYKMDQNVRVCTSTHRVIACRRTTITPLGPSATLYYGDPGTAPCNWKLTREKLIFPATTILMCFIINYHFAINSVYQGGGEQLKKSNEQAKRHSNKSVTQD